MIPYFHLEAFHLTDSLALQPFGLLVGTGVLMGAWLAKKRGAEVGISEQEVRDSIFWAVVPAFWMAHWFDLFLYHPEWFEEKGPLIFFKFWDGMSSFGGFFGALIGLSFYFKRKRKPW